MKSTKPALLLLPVLIGLQLATVTASELNVSVQGNATGNGSPQNPFRTISAAAQMAQPGDVILVHPGVYRERINPPRGGESDMKHIVYHASAGEPVVITGSELVTNWMQIRAEVWKAMIPNSFFGSFNPYTNLIHGDWFNPEGRAHHTGAVYLNADKLTEAATLDEVMKSAGDHAFWFGTVDKTNTTIWAQFKDVNPNRERVEINVRQTVFYPKKRALITSRSVASPWRTPPRRGHRPLPSRLG